MQSVTGNKAILKPFELIYDQKLINSRIAEIGREITNDYANETPVLLGVLKGCIVFLADLMRCIKLPVELEFVSATSYRQGEKQSKELKFESSVAIPLKGRHVLLVEGVVDSGRTVSVILKQLEQLKPASIEIVTLIDKPTCHRNKLNIKYKGFSMKNEFVIGYGLDNTQIYRNLPFIGRLIEQN